MADPGFRFGVCRGEGGGVSQVLGLTDGGCYGSSKNKYQGDYYSLYPIVLKENL